MVFFQYYYYRFFVQFVLIFYDGSHLTFDFLIHLLLLLLYSISCFHFLRHFFFLRYFRDLLRQRERGDATSLLKALNPQEAFLADPAAGLHIRFRLGGFSFPPAVYR